MAPTWQPTPLIRALLTALALAALLALVSNWYLLSRFSEDAVQEVAVGTAQPRAAKPRSPAEPKEKLHFAWVTDCSEYQEWQSLVLIWSIYRHQGALTPITRLISGCNSSEERRRIDTHLQLFPAASSTRSPSLFFTPPYIFNEALNDTYPPYNRPHSVRLWVETEAMEEGTMVVFLDPDMVMLKPLELPIQGHEPGAAAIYRMAAPFGEAQRLPALGQRYKYISNRWKQANLSLADICESNAPGCLAISEEDVTQHFAIGPPWIMRFGDLRRAAPLWHKYVPKIRTQYRQLIAEMYAYSLAFASLGVRHALFDHFVVSYPNAPRDEQAWVWIDAPPELEAQGASPVRPVADDARLPTFLHYCEIYYVEDWYWRKRNVIHDAVLDCDKPMFEEPSLDLLKAKRQAVADSDSSDHERQTQTVRQVWFLRTLTTSINEAVQSLRGRLCPRGFNNNRTHRCPYPPGSFYEHMAAFYKNPSG